MNKLKKTLSVSLATFVAVLATSNIAYSISEEGVVTGSGCFGVTDPDLGSGNLTLSSSDLSSEDRLLPEGETSFTHSVEIAHDFSSVFQDLSAGPCAQNYSLELELIHGDSAADSGSTILENVTIDSVEFVSGGVIKELTDTTTDTSGTINVNLTVSPDEDSSTGAGAFSYSIPVKIDATLIEN